MINRIEYGMSLIMAKIANLVPKACSQSSIYSANTSHEPEQSEGVLMSTCNHTSVGWLNNMYGVSFLMIIVRLLVYKKSEVDGKAAAAYD